MGFALRIVAVGLASVAIALGLIVWVTGGWWLKTPRDLQAGEVSLPG